MAITNKMIKTLINKLKEYKNSANIIQKIQELNLTADIIDNQLPLPSTMVNYANKNIKHLRQNPTIAEAMVLLDKYYDTIISSTQIELVTEHANFFVIDFLYCMNLIEAELKQHGMKLDQNLLPQFDKCQTSTTFTINYFKAILVYNYAITLYEPLFSHQATRKPKLPFKSKVPPTAITNYLQSKKILWKEPLLTLIKLIESKQYQQFIPTDMIQDAKVIAINCGAACVNKMLHRNTSKQTEKIIKDLHLTIKVLNPLLKLYANTTAKLVKEYKKKPYTNINANKLHNSYMGFMETILLKSNLHFFSTSKMSLNQREKTLVSKLRPAAKYLKITYDDFIQLKVYFSKTETKNIHKLTEHINRLSKLPLYKPAPKPQQKKNVEKTAATIKSLTIVLNDINEKQVIINTIPKTNEFKTTDTKKIQASETEFHKHETQNKRTNTQRNRRNRARKKRNRLRKRQQMQNQSSRQSQKSPNQKSNFFQVANTTVPVVNIQNNQQTRENKISTALTIKSQIFKTNLMSEKSTSSYEYKYLQSNLFILCQSMQCILSGQTQDKITALHTIKFIHGHLQREPFSNLQNSQLHEKRNYLLCLTHLHQAYYHSDCQMCQTHLEASYNFVPAELYSGHELNEIIYKYRIHLNNQILENSQFRP